MVPQGLIGTRACLVRASPIWVLRNSWGSRRPLRQHEPPEPPPQEKEESPRRICPFGQRAETGVSYLGPAPGGTMKNVEHAKRPSSG